METIYLSILFIFTTCFTYRQKQQERQIAGAKFDSKKKMKNVYQANANRLTSRYKISKIYYPANHQ